MKELVSKILDVIMYLIPFFGKRKRNRVVREVRYNASCKEVCEVKTTEREKGCGYGSPFQGILVLGVSLLYMQVGRSGTDAG